MFTKKPIVATLFILVMAVSVLAVGVAPVDSLAASHREAPLISLDPTADITDFFMFRSYEPGQENKVVLIMDVIPGEEPSSGPNYWNFDPSVLYTFNIDNNADGRAEDVRFEFKFRSEFTGVPKALGLFLSYLGNVPPSTGAAVPPITALEGSGSEGLGLRQRYTLTMVKNDRRTVLADGLIAVPSNVGPRTMPDYDSLAAQGIYELENGVRVFAGQRDDPFYIDLGAIFDTINLRGPGAAADMLSGFNVHTIALEIPASLLTRDGQGIDETLQPVLGGYASTSRRRVAVLNADASDSAMRRRDEWVQVQRLANPLVNEAIIGTEFKDRWNALSPAKEGEFLEFYRNPRLATALSLVFDGAPVPETPRDDLVNLLLKYGPDDRGYSELLRLNLAVVPRPLSEQARLTVLAGDDAGWPNGRRPIDDVTDVAIQVVGGPSFAGAGDSVDVNDMPLPETFPFLATPWDGRNRVHTNGMP